ncbi:hypothetical protein DPMN_032066 [Dreissena polymorpha]|uniref:Uncharacterized protein n=1 Tax=Dreissena polymorpha TaxID=45954 RepID=A0A9D4M3H5_DREPO|nr:hypothetical protein DPMN_032066 [Dreissena polymorpha]
MIFAKKKDFLETKSTLAVKRVVPYKPLHTAPVRTTGIQPRFGLQAYSPGADYRHTAPVRTTDIQPRCGLQAYSPGSQREGRMNNSPRLTIPRTCFNKVLRISFY